jgi:hypothetical protein
MKTDSSSGSSIQVNMTLIRTSGSSRKKEKIDKFFYCFVFRFFLAQNIFFLLFKFPLCGFNVGRNFCEIEFSREEKNYSWEFFIFLLLFSKLCQGRR